MGDTLLTAEEIALVEEYGGDWIPSSRVIILPEEMTRELVEQLRRELHTLWEQRGPLDWQV